jgi:uncharacterized protein (TIGR02646 family)
MIEFTINDIDSLKKASLEPTATNAWSYTQLKKIKSKIKTEKLERQGYLCCYCSTDLYRVHSISIDIEHVLPKSDFRKYMFTIKNLSAACKQCNMTLKNKDSSFIIESDLFNKKPFLKKHYEFIHPTLEIYEKHIFRRDERAGRNIITTFEIKTPKGQYTYEYFKLHEIEKRALDKSQGQKTPKLDKAVIDEDIAQKVMKVLDTRQIY